METVIGVLKAMGKASYREVAARLKIEPVEALNMLREQREQGLCDFYEGGWEITGGEGKKTSSRKPAVKPVTSAQSDLQSGLPEPVRPEVITALLQENGAMDTVALAAAVGRNARGMVTVMRALERGGVVNKIGQGKGVKWELRAENQTPASEANEPAQQRADNQVPILPEVRSSPSTAELVSAIPSFTESYPGDLIIPSPSDIVRMIRKAKRELRELEQVRLLSVAAKKCRKTLNRIHSAVSTGR
ncbi:DUF1627 domain-containing protein [Escherichia coli]|uniref:DUF1627 domain-containing protein n=1 Tax=Escherichia coli TaxID=562 RepID=UPI0021D2F4B6|nr:DUF1627 domain-containing protein [Escherichia coli]MCU6262199.1 DUF1627 domain-containing protein [Escherichia coli]